MFDLTDFNISQPKLKATFDSIRPTLIAKFQHFLDSNRTSNRGRKRSVNLETIFKALYSTIKDGTSSTNFPYFFGLPKSTYSYYFKLLQKSKILEDLNCSILDICPDSETFFADTFTVKSHKGSEGLGRNPTDRGRSGIKVQIISDEKGIIKSLVTAPANHHDSKILINSLPSILIEGNQRDLLLDSAYIGEKVKQAVQAKNLCPLVVPRKKKNGEYTHQLNEYQTNKIKTRWKVEQHIGIIRTNKGVSNKYTVYLKTYKFYLEFVKLLINCYFVYVR